MDEFYSSLDQERDKISRFEDYLDEVPSLRRNWLVTSYRGFFNIDSTTVASRIWKSNIFHCADSFFGESVADLYGPLWCSTSLVFIGLFLQDTLKDFAFRIFLFALLVYGVLFSVPFAIICLVKHVTFSYMLSLYGYSFSGFSFFVAFSGIFPESYKSFIIIFGGLWTFAVLIRNILKEVKLSLKMILFTCLIVGLGHITLVVLSIYVI